MSKNRRTTSARPAAIPPMPPLRPGGLRCWACGDDAAIRVRGVIDLDVAPDGSAAHVPPDPAITWAAGDPAYCNHCGVDGELSDFLIAEQDEDAARLGRDDDA